MTDIFRFIRFFVSVASGQAADAVAARNLLSDAISLVPKESVWVGTTDTAMYYPRLAGKRVALLANHTSMIGERHLVDVLHARIRCDCNLRSGARIPGTADPGEHMGGSVDAATGIPIRSLCDGNTRRPSDEAMHSFEVA